MAEKPISSPPAQVVSLQGEPLDPATAGRPAPPVPADCSLRQFDWMPFFGVRWLNSARRFKAPPGGLDAMLALQVEAWRQVPASSLPNDDTELAHLAGLARTPDAWRKVRKWVMEEWVLHSDGRLYHLEMAERALDAWKAGDRHRKNQQAYRERMRNGEAGAGKSAKGKRNVRKAKEVTITGSSPDDHRTRTLAPENEKEREKETPYSEGQSPSAASPAAGLQEPAAAAFQPPAPPPPAPPAEPPAAPARRRQPAATRKVRQPEELPGGDLVDAMPGKSGAAVMWDEAVARWQRIMAKSGQQCPTPDTARVFIGELMKRAGGNLPKVMNALIAADLAQVPPASPRQFVYACLSGDRRPASGIASRSTGEDHLQEALRHAAQNDAAIAARRNPHLTLGPARGPVLEGECS